MFLMNLLSPRYDHKYETPSLWGSSHLSSLLTWPLSASFNSPVSCKNVPSLWSSKRLSSAWCLRPGKTWSDSPQRIVTRRRLVLTDFQFQWELTWKSGLYSGTLLDTNLDRRISPNNRWLAPNISTSTSRNSVVPFFFIGTTAFSATNHQSLVAVNVEIFLESLIKNMDGS